MKSLIFIICFALFALFYAGYLFWRVKKRETRDDERIDKIAANIYKIAMHFFEKEYKNLGVLILFLSFIIYFIPSLGAKYAILFICGAIIAALFGYAGMKNIIFADRKAIQLIRENQRDGLKYIFSWGAIDGIAAIGLGVFIMSLSYLFSKDAQSLYAFCAGIILISLFMQIRGGIFAKTAKSGVQAMKNIEPVISENDARNPASIARLAGENIFSMAGIGISLLGSYFTIIVSAMALGAMPILRGFGNKVIILPLILAMAGIFSFGAGILWMKSSIKGSLDRVLDRSVWGTSLSMIIISCFAIRYYLGRTTHEKINAAKIFYTLVLGILAGVAAYGITQYYSARKNKKIFSDEKKSMGWQMALPVIMLLIIFSGIIMSCRLANFYGAAIFGIGFVSIMIINLHHLYYSAVARDTFAISEMAHFEEATRNKLKNLHAMGEKFIFSGMIFDYYTAALSALILILSFIQTMEIKIDASLPIVLSFIMGFILPMLFILGIKKVTKNNKLEILESIKRQFREIQGIIAYKASPEYEECGMVCAHGTKIVFIAVLSLLLLTAVLGYWGGAMNLAGLIMGISASGIILSLIVFLYAQNRNMESQAGNLSLKEKTAKIKSLFQDIKPWPHVIIGLVAITCLIMASLL